MKKEKFLFTIDLDGTLLAKSDTNLITEKTFEKVQKLKEEGHIICILTGRPWRTTKDVYEKLGLNTIVGNYNGSHLHNPTDNNFVPRFKFIPLKDVLYILHDEELQKHITNISFEGLDWVQVEKEDEILSKLVGFVPSKENPYGLFYDRMESGIVGVVFDIKADTDIYSLKNYMQRKYGDIAEISSWTKGKGLNAVIDMIPKGCSKGSALSFLTRYYNVDLKNTIAIGDALNDVPMFEIAQTSVSMGNADKQVSKYAKIKLTKSNKEDGIVEFLDNYFYKK